MSSNGGFGTPDDRSLRRFTLRACLLGLVGAYATVLPLKARGWMPPHISWLGALVVPPVMFGWLASLVIVPSWFPRCAALAVIIPTLLCAAVLFAVILLERA
jgi:hypothetical protein